MLAVGDVSEDPDDADDISDDSAPLADSVAPDDLVSAGVLFSVSDVLSSDVFSSEVFWSAEGSV